MATVGDETQWITSVVQLPQAVLDEHAAGRVVFFVGAGASVGAPSKLPLFEELVVTLGKEAGIDYSKPEALDHFLGRLTHLNPPYAVHERTRILLTPPTSKPNSLHSAIVNLAAAHGRPRIVTTNFDDHLDTAAKAAGVKFCDKWIGPALPLGETVDGLVHLHGSITRDANSLILTDKDLGHAYLADAWATRFLLRLFQFNTVVFVGYSLADPTLRYLTLGMPAGAKLYAFVTAAAFGDPDWERLGVQPISFGHDFGNLPAALEAWNTRARMGRLEHQARVTDIVLAGPKLTPVDRDYLCMRLRSQEGAQDFVNAAEKTLHGVKLDWLRWLEGIDEFKPAFQLQPVTDAVRTLGDWYANAFVADPKFHGAALQVLQRSGQSMSESVFRASSWIMDRLAKRDPGAGRRWMAVLSTSIIGHSSPLETESLLPYIPDVSARSTSMLRSALRPLLQLKPRWFVDPAEELLAVPDAEVTWQSDELTFTHHLLLGVGSRGDTVSLGAALEDALLAAYDLLDDYHGPRDWDPLAYGRSAIEAHQQDSMRDPIDAVIDALREFGVLALPAQSELPSRWWMLQRPLFRRLALHLISVDVGRSSDEKIDWLLARTGLYASYLKHESFYLLDVALGGTSEASRQAVLAATLTGPSYPDDVDDSREQSQYAVYNLLVWITRSAPQWEEAKAAFDTLQAANPNFAPREHPDFDSWMTTGTWGPTMPMSVDQFVQALTLDSVSALDDLISRDYSERFLNGPTWGDALNLVREAIRPNPKYGLELWDHLVSRNDLSTRSSDLRKTITEAWAEADLDQFASDAVQRVATIVSDESALYAIARFLRDQIRAQIEHDETPPIGQMRRLAISLFAMHSAGFTHESDDPLSFAPLYLNSWPGLLAQYWMSEIDRSWRCNREGWDGLDAEHRDALMELLSAPRPTLDATQPVLAGELFFLFSADEEFATEHVLPIFADDRNARFAWIPYLRGPRYNDKLLAAGLLDATITQWARLNDSSDHALKHQFFLLVASIVSFAGIADESRKTLLARSVIASDGAYASDFAQTIVQFLGEEGINGAEIWSHWLRDHLAERLAGVPRTAEPEELARWADVVPYVGERIPEAAHLLAGRGIGFGVGHFSRELPNDSLSLYGDILVEHFSERVRNTDATNPMITYSVCELIDFVRSSVGEESARPLLDSARDSGFDVAVGWSRD